MDKRTITGGPGLEYVVRDAAGDTVVLGDTVTSFRGETATLLKVLRPERPGSSGKVTTTLGTHYATVYGLTIRVATGQPAHDCTATCWEQMNQQGLSETCSVDDAYQAAARADHE